MVDDQDVPGSQKNALYICWYSDLSHVTTLKTINLPRSCGDSAHFIDAGNGRQDAEAAHSEPSEKPRL